MFRILVLWSIFSLFYFLEADGSRFSRGLTRIGNNFLKRVDDPIPRLNTGSSLTSVYVGSTGIWWRSYVIASISQMEQGEKEKAMETLNIAIATLAVFDITQATVSPIASELIHQLVKHRGTFPDTVRGLTEYNRVVAERVVSASADDADEIIDNAKKLKKQIGEFFDSEVTAFMKNAQGYDDLVTSLNNAKSWAKALTWVDTISGPLFDAANIAFCGWQLHNAIQDKDSAPEVRSLNIASASLGVASGAVGLTAFVVGALATAGSTLALVAGPVGAIIGCLLSLAAIIIDLVNSINPYGDIKNHLETIQKLKEGSLQYLHNQENVTHQLTSVFKFNTGFDTIYEINQGNLIVGMRGDSIQHISGVDRDPNIIFDAKVSPGHENGYLTLGKNRIFDKSKYQNLIYKPEGIVQLGFDFYGKITKRHGKGMTVVANTAMVAEQFWIRGVHIDTRVENDEEEGNPDNVVIGEMTGLADTENSIRVYTGAGDDLLQVTGLPCNLWTYHRNCLWGVLGTGINTLSFQGMSPDRVAFPTGHAGSTSKVFVGIKFDMRYARQVPTSELYLRMKNSESSPVTEYKIGYVQGVNVFHGSPLDDEIVMGDDKSCVVKIDGGNNKYIIYLSNEHDFTHTIEDDSEALGEIYLVKRTRTGRYENHNVRIRDVIYDEETQTLVTFMRHQNGKHKFTGRIIFKRTKPGHLKEMKLYLVRAHPNLYGCEQVPSLHSEGLDCGWEDTLESMKRAIGSRKQIYGSTVDDRPVPSVPFHYDLDINLEVEPIPDLCGDFIISFGYFQGERLTGESQEFSLRLPTNSFIAIADELMDWVKDWDAQYVLYYLKSDKKIVYEHRVGQLTHAWYTVKIHVPEAKRIVFGTTGNHQLLLDLKNDHRTAVNLGSEHIGLASRSVDEYKFTGNYENESPKPKQLVLGVPAKRPTQTRWIIEFGRAQTYAGKQLEDEGEGRSTTGDYAENALIVGENLWKHLKKEGNDLEFKPSQEEKNAWEITVKKGSQNLHQALVQGANTLAYHERLVRINLYDLVNGVKEDFSLKVLWTAKMEALESEIVDGVNIC